MSESREDQFARVRLMASGDTGNWDLSPNDTAALQTVVAELSRMRTALEEMFKLVEDGVLVRDISHDDKPGWAMGAMRLVRVLKQAQDAIAERALTAGSGNE